MSVFYDPWQWHCTGLYIYGLRPFEIAHVLCVPEDDVQSHISACSPKTNRSWQFFKLLRMTQDHTRSRLPPASRKRLWQLLRMDEAEWKVQEHCKTLLNQAMPRQRESKATVLLARLFGLPLKTYLDTLWWDAISGSIEWGWDTPCRDADAFADELCRQATLEADKYRSDERTYFDLVDHTDALIRLIHDQQRRRVMQFIYLGYRNIDDIAKVLSRRGKPLTTKDVQRIHRQGLRELRDRIRAAKDVARIAW